MNSERKGEGDKKKGNTLLTHNKGEMHLRDKKRTTRKQLLKGTQECSKKTTERKTKTKTNVNTNGASNTQSKTVQSPLYFLFEILKLSRRLNNYDYF